MTVMSRRTLMMRSLATLGTAAIGDSVAADSFSLDFTQVPTPAGFSCETHPEVCELLDAESEPPLSDFSTDATTPRLAGLPGTRRLWLNHSQIGETIDIVYYADGRYLPGAAAEIRNLYRDRRNGQTHHMDWDMIDAVSTMHSLLDVDSPLILLSGYRSPATNALLRSQGAGAARNSLHMRGMASDLTIGSRSVAQMYRAAMRVGAGGVGKYTGSNFVHMDSGPVRTWGS